MKKESVEKQAEKKRQFMKQIESPDEQWHRKLPPTLFAEEYTSADMGFFYPCGFALKLGDIL